jgi:chromosome segregation ATPase
MTAAAAQSPIPETYTPSSRLGVSLQADYDALKNDLEQAHDLAADFQRQLAGKSNEVAHFKNLLERTQTDLNRLDAHVQELRKERHRLANEVMRSAALEQQLKRSREEIDRLKLEVETLRSAGGNRVEELLVVSEEQQKEIARLRAAVDVLKKGQTAGAASSSEDARMQQQIAELTTLVKRLQGALDGQCRTDGRKAPAQKSWDAEVINLTFES